MLLSYLLSINQPLTRKRMTIQPLHNRPCLLADYLNLDASQTFVLETRAIDSMLVALLYKEGVTSVLGIERYTCNSL